MLSKISRYLTKNQKYKQFIITNTISIKNHSHTKQLTSQLIKQANNVKELIQFANINDLVFNRHFSQFMFKVTQLMNKQVRQDPQSIACLREIMVQFRKNNPVEINYSASDLLNYHLFLKKLKFIQPKQWQTQQFEIMVTTQAQAIPANASLTGSDPIAVALLYYMLSFTQLQSQFMNENMHQYFLNYFQNLQQIEKQNKIIQQTLQNKQINNFNLNNNNQFVFHPNICAILISCAQITTKKTLSSVVQHRVLFNFAKRLPTIKQYLGIGQLTQLYLSKYSNHKQLKLTFQQKQQIKQVMIKKYKLNPNLQLSTPNQPEYHNQIIVVNKYRQFLQCIDVFINLLSIDYKNIVKVQIDYRISQQLSRYFYMIFLLTQNMNIYLATHHNHQLLSSIQDIEQQNQQYYDICKITLWKISAQIVQAFSKNRIYNRNKNKILQLILFKIIDTLKTMILKQKISNQQQNIKDQQKQTNVNKQQNNIKQKIIDNKNSIIKIFIFMPIQIIQNQYKKDSNTHQYILQIFKLCIEQQPTKSQDRTTLIKNIINFYQFKKNLIIQRTEWIKIFQCLVQQNKKHEDWILYFFLGASNQQTLIDLIPFPAIISNLSKDRQLMQKCCSYLPAHQLSTTYKLKKQATPNQQLQQEITKKAKSRSWQLSLLKFHALATLVNLDSSIPSLLSKNCSHYKITTQQIQNLFSLWMQPFKSSLISQIRKSNGSIVNNLSFSQQTIIYYQKYFQNVFVDTAIYYQMKLIHKILTFSSVQNYLLHWKNYANYNFLPYFFTLLYGLADSKHRSLYLTKYPLQKLFPFNITLKIFNNQVYHHKIYEMISQLFLQIQWSYFLKCLLSINAIFQGKTLYIGIIQYQDIHKTSSIKIDQNSKITPLIPKTLSNKPPQQLNQQLYKFLDYNFNQTYNYNTIKPGYKYQPNIFIKINQIIINSFLQNLIVPLYFSYQINARLTFVANYLYELSLIHQINLQPNLIPFIQKQQQQQLNQIIMNSKLQDDKQLSILIHKFRYLKILAPQSIKNLCQNINFTHKPSITKLICFLTLGRAVSIQLRLITDNAWNTMQKQIVQVSRLNDHSFIWLYYSLICSQPLHFNTYLHLLKHIYHPTDRNFYILQLINIKAKFNIINGPSIHSLLSLLHNQPFVADNLLANQSEYIDGINANVIGKQEQINVKKQKFFQNSPKKNQFFKSTVSQNFHQKSDINQNDSVQNKKNEKQKLYSEDEKHKAQKDSNKNKKFFK